MRYLIVLFLLTGCAASQNQPMSYTEARTKAQLVIHEMLPDGCIYSGGYSCKDKITEEYLNKNAPQEHEVAKMIEGRNPSYQGAEWFVRKMYGCQRVGIDTVCEIPWSEKFLAGIDKQIIHTEKNGKHHYVAVE